MRVKTAQDLGVDSTTLPGFLGKYYTNYKATEKVSSTDLESEKAKVINYDREIFG